METNTDTLRPEALPYKWPSHDLKNLVLLAPMSPYTRALLRIKFNCPVPDGATNFEQIEAWLATLKPLKPIPAPEKAWTPPHNPEADEIRRGEFVEVDAKETGYNRYTRDWVKQGRIEVPLSIWEQGMDEVRDYVANEISEYTEDEDGSDYEFDTSGDDTDFCIESDLDDLMEEAERLISQRDGADEDEE
jgi:hypothetical protein